jgi:hypothetical protein
MNTKYKLVRLVVAAAFGSLLWAGCASERTYYTDSSVNLRPVDLTEWRVDTHPERQNAAENYAGWNQTVEVPVDGSTINEAAGARRPR